MESYSTRYLSDSQKAELFFKLHNDRDAEKIIDLDGEAMTCRIACGELVDYAVLTSEVVESEYDAEFQAWSDAWFTQT